MSRRRGSDGVSRDVDASNDICSCFEAPVCKLGDFNLGCSHLPNFAHHVELVAPICQDGERWRDSSGSS